MSATAVVNIPEKLAVGTNKFVVESSLKAVEKLEGAITATVDALMSLLLLVVRHYLNTYACILDFLAAATFGSVQYYATTVQSFVNYQAAQISAALVAGINNINDSLQAAQQSGLGALQGFLNNIPGVNVNFNLQGIAVFPQVQAGLQNIQLIPQDFVNGLKDIKIPSAVAAEAQLLNSMKQPAELLKAKIVTGLSSIELFGDPLPVPTHIDGVNICSSGVAYNNSLDAIGSFEKSVSSSISYLSTIVWISFVVVVCFSVTSAALLYWNDLATKRAIAAIIESAEGKHSTREQNQNVAASVLERVKDPLVYSMTTATVHLPLPGSPVILDRLQWYIRYTLHPGSLAITAVGIAGILLISSSQAVLADSFQHLRTDLNAEMCSWEVQGRGAIGIAVYEATSPWAAGVNVALSNAENTINSKVFGWIGDVVAPVNNTLNSLTNVVTGGIQTAFGEVPPLQQALLSLFGCLLGAPLRELEDGLNALAHGLSINLPKVNETSIAVEAESLLNVMTTTRVAIVGTRNDDTGEWHGGLVGALQDKYVAALEADRNFFGNVLLLGLVVPMIGLVKICWWLFVDIADPIIGPALARSLERTTSFFSNTVMQGLSTISWVEPSWLHAILEWRKREDLSDRQQLTKKSSTEILQTSSATDIQTSPPSLAPFSRQTAIANTGLRTVPSTKLSTMPPSGPATASSSLTLSHVSAPATMFVSPTGLPVHPNRSSSASLLDEGPSTSSTLQRDARGVSRHGFRMPQMDARFADQLKRRISGGRK
ncbi:hypothetical protein M427DRAFT_148545 [Gonapodya prolifera JEL478]|uniref:Plasma membrane fusion protein PRM1 n=1 Tax=Gonapodya prolifera (strain JEL478) TaxID=1344416 RepID=A0A139A183_GONPJ|nr:hypothetical protein M427DRAFT_148545 [Gonapodya prolifera JEL478]|eukprot:KXS10537.1 hypothetical protein M427DRAFT_148545 [Gonapodya prolifera JEL478]